MTQIFTIGKVIQIRSSPLKINRLAFIETEEHIRQVIQMLDWLYPNARENLRQAACLHDIGKKIYLQSDFTQGDKRLTQQKLGDDFYQSANGGETFTAEEAIQRYLTFLKQGHAKPFPVYKNSEDENSPIAEVRYQLDPPFGQHAAMIERTDLRGVADGQLDYVHTLIQLHHNFQVDKLVAAAAEHGEDIINDLYCLITADQEASRWAEFVVQTLEKGAEKPEGRFRFSEFSIEPVSSPEENRRKDAHVQGQVTLKASHCPAPSEWAFVVDYYVTECDFLTPELRERKRGGKKR